MDNYTDMPKDNPVVLWACEIAEATDRLAHAKQQYAAALAAQKTEQ